MTKVNGFKNMPKFKNEETAKRLLDLKDSKAQNTHSKPAREPKEQPSPPAQKKKPTAVAPVIKKKTTVEMATEKRTTGWVPFDNSSYYVCDGLSIEKIEEEFRRVSLGGSAAKKIIRGVREYCVRISCIQDRNYALQKEFEQFRGLLNWMNRQLQTTNLPPVANPLPIPETGDVGEELTGLTNEDVVLIEEGRVNRPQHLFAENFTTDTQYCGENYERKCDVVIGLDFGTSCTKVVVRTPYEHDRSWIVPFGPFAHRDVTGFLPTHISLSQDNQYFFPETDERGTYSNLKMDLIRYLANQANNELSDVKEIVVAYFALIFRYVRNWFMTEQGQYFGRFKLVWHVNIGVPSNPTSLANVQKNIFDLYRQVGCSAWLLSVTQGEITRDNVRASWVRCHSQRHDCSHCESHIDQRLEVYPELVGEVAGYAMSTHREEGLHLMIDVGAGTLDVCIFNLARNMADDDCYALEAADVQPHGVGMLDVKRRRVLKDKLQVCMDESRDLVSPVPLSPFDYLAGVKEADKDVLIEFEKLCREQIRSVINKFNIEQRREIHEYNLAPRWNRHLPVFLCGGGSKLPFFQDLMVPFSEWLRGFIVECDGIKLINPLAPENINIERDLFYRFSVAWGLSRPKDDIGHYWALMQAGPEPQGPDENGPWWTRPYSYWLD